MATFTMNGKEYDLKITWKAAQYLNKHIANGTMGVIGAALQGDLDAFPHIVHASLFHHGENFAFADVVKAIEEGAESGDIDAAFVFNVGSEVVAESFFYKKLMENVLKEKPEALEQLKSLTQG